MLAYLRNGTVPPNDDKTFLKLLMLAGTIGCEEWRRKSGRCCTTRERARCDAAAGIFFLTSTSPKKKMAPVICERDLCFPSLVPKTLSIFLVGGVSDSVDVMHHRLGQFVVVLSVCLCCLWTTSEVCRVGTRERAMV